MPRRPVGRKSQTLAVIRKGSTAEERAKIEAQIDALQLAARWAGFPSYQSMTVHIWNRVTAQTVDALILDGYTAVDATIREITERVRATAGKIQPIK